MEEKKMSKYSNYVKPIGIVIASGLSFIISLVAFLITAISSTYDDGYGVSYMYGKKDLLVITISSFILLLLGIILLVNCLKKKRTDPWISPVFTLATSTIFFLFLAGQILKPIMSGSVEFTTTYILNILSLVFGLGAFVLGIVIVINFILGKHALLNIVFMRLSAALYCFSVFIYSLSQGVDLINGNDLTIGILFIAIGVINLLELAPLSYFQRMAIGE